MVNPKETNEMRPIINELITKIYQQTKSVQGIDNLDFKALKEKQ